jgi:hypothetical protein
MADEGHAKIAAMMSHYNEFAIFRKFSKLNYQNLLYLQAELTHLEANLEQVVDRDCADPNREHYAKDWWYLVQNNEEHDSREQWQKFLQIRKKLKECSIISQLHNRYHRLTQADEHLALSVFLKSLKPPTTHDLEFMADWQKRPKIVDFPLIGKDKHVWSLESTDLLAIHRLTSSSPFTRWLSNVLIPFLHRILLYRYKKLVQNDPESSICKYDEKEIERVMDILVTVLASLIPISSILILYFVSSTLN